MQKPTAKRCRPRANRLGIEVLESRIALTGDPTLTASEVQSLLGRAAAASSTNQAVIAVVDRSGNILGVKEEQGVISSLGINTPASVFAIDGAVAEARTAAFFSNDTAPLTSRTIQFISQSTITQREVQSSPDASTAATIIDDTQATYVGPWASYPVGYNNNQHFIAAGNGSATATYSFTGLQPGTYQVLATWPAASNHGTNVPYTVYDGNTSLGTTTVNQQQPVASGQAGLNDFQPLTTVYVSSGTLKVIINNNANGYVIADAVEIVPVSSPPTISGTTPATTIIASQTVAPFSGVTLSAVDPALPTFTVAVTLSNAANGTLSNLSGGTYTGGVFTLSNVTLQQAQTALQGLTFSGAAPAGASDTTTFTIQLSSDSMVATDNTTTVTTNASPFLQLLDDNQATYVGSWLLFPVGFDAPSITRPPATAAQPRTTALRDWRLGNIRSLRRRPPPPITARMCLTFYPTARRPCLRCRLTRR